MADPENATPPAPAVEPTAEPSLDAKWDQTTQTMREARASPEISRDLGRPWDVYGEKPQPVAPAPPPPPRPPMVPGAALEGERRLRDQHQAEFDALRAQAEAAGYVVDEDSGRLTPPAQHAPVPNEPPPAPAPEPWQAPLPQGDAWTVLNDLATQHDNLQGWEPGRTAQHYGPALGMAVAQQNERILGPMADQAIAEKVRAQASQDPDFPLYRASLSRLLTGMPLGYRLQVAMSPSAWGAAINAAKAEHFDALNLRAAERLRNPGHTVGSFYVEGASPGMTPDGGALAPPLPRGLESWAEGLPAANKAAAARRIAAARQARGE